MGEDQGHRDIPSLSFDEACQAIAQLAPRGWRLGLDRMQHFARQLGLQTVTNPAAAPKYIQVAGTNGKGSVTAFVQSLLVEHGYRTGAFFSPHVYSIRERMQFGRDYISETDFARIASRLLHAADRLEGTEFAGVTEFELKTALGFAFFEEKDCDWAALEVGLGGRLDATSVASPQCGVIVSIGLDHTGILGETEAEIAREKAGILKEGMPLVLGRVSPEAEKVILAAAYRTGSDLMRYGEEVTSWLAGDKVRYSIDTEEFETNRPRLLGDIQIHNSALALASLLASGIPLDPEAVNRGIVSASLPGRMEERIVLGRRIILDGAHNESAADVLSSALVDFPCERLILVTGMLQGHDPSEFYEHFYLAESVHWCPIDFHRARDPEDLHQEFEGVFPSSVAHESVREAVMAALDECGPQDLILVTGSFYLVGEVGHVLESI